jgi:5-methylcytosine-specific restriction endonuclease McrA
MGFYALACQIGVNGARWREMLVGYIVERDGPRCGICQRKVDLTLKSGPKGDDRGPSIDHIVPRSQGGDDDLANLRLAHWGCNRARKAKGGNEQLALVG